MSKNNSTKKVDALYDVYVRRYNTKAREQAMIPMMTAEQFHYNMRELEKEYAAAGEQFRPMVAAKELAAKAAKLTPRQQAAYYQAFVKTLDEVKTLDIENVPKKTQEALEKLQDLLGDSEDVSFSDFRMNSTAYMTWSEKYRKDTEVADFFRFINS